MNAARITLRSIGALFLAVQLAAARQPPPPPTFRTSTELVQVSVIVQDKHGQPVADLRREEFQVFDNGVPQEIRLFVAEKPTPSPTAAARAPNTFTNQIVEPGGSRSGYTVILFDNLVTGFGEPGEDGTSFGVQKVLQTLRAIPEGEKIALYAIGRDLQIVREFTTDEESLERQLRIWKPRPDDAEIGHALCPAGDPPSPLVGQLAPEVAVALGRAGGECVRLDMLTRLKSFDEQLRQIADHLAGIPGRKNLIWMANRFPITGGPAVERLMDAGVAIYPVDEGGVCRTCPPRPKEQMRALAELTGGTPFFERNDLDVAVREAMVDGRVSYTLGFYQPGEDRKAGVHQLAVRVSRPGVTLRYHAAYRTVAPEKVSGNPAADLVKAMNRPMDATAILIMASAKRTQDRLDLMLSFDVSSLGLELSEGLWKGKAELIARLMTANGIQTGDVLSQTVTFNLRPATYASMLQRGAPWRRELKIPPKAVELKVLVGNLASGRMGTLTIPLFQIASQMAPSQIDGGAANAK